MLFAIQFQFLDSVFVHWFFKVSIQKITQNNRYQKIKSGKKIQLPNVVSCGINKIFEQKKHKTVMQQINRIGNLADELGCICYAF